MAKHGRTKKKIIELIRSGNNNLSTISEELDLAPSTVSKHLQDLEEVGLITQKDDSHIKKWKYYEVNEQRLRMEDDRRGQGFFGGRAVVLTAVVLLALVLSGAAYIYGSSLVSKTSGTYVPISITDPPQVPAGTQALYINYSSLKAKVGSGYSSQWVSLNTSGRLDLMGLVNASEIIGGVSVAAGQRVESVEFNIDSASIMIDNVSYPVIVQGNQIVAALDYNGVVNSSSGILLDFSPVVIPLPASNSTSFVMLPSVRAAMVNWMGQGPSPNSYFGGPRPLPQGYRDMFNRPQADITAYNVSVIGSAGNASIGFTLNNDGANTIQILGISVAPSMPVITRNSPFERRGNATANYTHYPVGGAAAQGNRSRPPIAGIHNGGPMQQQGLYRQENSAVVINSSAVYNTWNTSRSDSVHIHLQNATNDIYISNLGAAFNSGGPGNAMAFTGGAVGFMVESNGTLSTTPNFKAASVGYNLTPGSSEQFHYVGRISMKQDGLLNATGYILNIMTDQGVVRVNITK